MCCPWINLLCGPWCREGWTALTYFLFWSQLLKEDKDFVVSNMDVVYSSEASIWYENWGVVGYKSATDRGN